MQHAARLLSRAMPYRTIMPHQGSSVAAAFNSLLTERILKGDQEREHMFDERVEFQADLSTACVLGEARHATTCRRQLIAVQLQHGFRQITAVPLLSSHVDGRDSQ